MLFNTELRGPTDDGAYAVACTWTAQQDDKWLTVDALAFFTAATRIVGLELDTFEAPENTAHHHALRLATIMHAGTALRFRPAVYLHWELGWGTAHAIHMAAAAEERQLAYKASRGRRPRLQPWRLYNNQPPEGQHPNPHQGVFSVRKGVCGSLTILLSVSSLPSNLALAEDLTRRLQQSLQNFVV